MKSIKSGLILMALSLLIHSAAINPLWAMMPTMEGENDPSKRTISRKNPNEENKQTQPLSRKKQLKQMALLGDKESQYELGKMFRDGDSTFKEPSKAVKWFDLSAKQGQIDAMNALSQMCLEGTDIPQDYKLAFKWTKKLLEHNDAEGQHRAGDMYKNGWGVKKDETEAIKWYQKSAAQGYEPSRKALGLTTSKDEMKGDFEKAKTKQEEKPYIPTPSGVVNRPVVSDIVIPEIARGYEEIYRRFVMGKLIYKPDPKSDKGRIELPIRALANPLEGTFDLSQCGDSGKYLSISTGYRKVKGYKDKVEVWIAPRFLIEKELQSTAAHYAPIMRSWDAKTAPIGVFFTWGMDDMDCFTYVCAATPEKLSSENLCSIAGEPTSLTRGVSRALQLALFNTYGERSHGKACEKFHVHL